MNVWSRDLKECLLPQAEDAPDNDLYTNTERNTMHIYKIRSQYRCHSELSAVQAAATVITCEVHGKGVAEKGR